ncbi:hypothetical protein M4951_03705 [Blastopirellula sp. J2-11]|uniref:hypothetical protein n=1 Tax=Blastopirellula sp. J2-11 TaxID=2943192 RepID=UPI0021C87FC1|nr:hypothetical protein [Blastopirellula sp. J2-11]UUO07420.1 hypothetical protein M4951_03705 [Blastopirellula sp. J2-11]
MHSKNRAYGLAGFLLITVMIAGCGRSDGLQRTVVSGTVSYNGEPISRGAIWFVPTASVGNQAPTGFAVIQEGRYATAANKGPVSGLYTLKITGFDGAEPTAAEKEELLGGVFPGHPLFPEYVQEHEIAGDTMTLDIEVPKAGAKKSRR